MPGRKSSDPKVVVRRADLIEQWICVAQEI